MFLLVLIMILILTIIYFLVGLLIAQLALRWLAWLFSTTKNSGKYLDLETREHQFSSKVEVWQESD